MLQRVDVQIIQTAIEIRLVPARVLIEPALPNASLAALRSTASHSRTDPAARQPAGREQAFDSPPPGRIVRIAPRHFPDGMDVIGKENDADDLKRSIAANFYDRISKATPADLCREDRPAMMSDDGEEVDGAFAIATVVAHSRRPVTSFSPLLL